MTQAHMEIIAYIVHNKENNITFKSLNNFFWKWIVALVCPEHFTIMRCNFRWVYVKVLVTFALVVVIKVHVLVPATGYYILPIHVTTCSRSCLIILMLIRIMVFNVHFNNISVISWRSVLMVEETGGHGGNHWPVGSHWQTLSNNVVSSTPRHERGSNSQHQWW